jgi:predicted NBD/HSP70 family sugar kinase
MLSVFLKGSPSNVHHKPSLPCYVPEQIAVYRSDHLLTQEVCRFDPTQAVKKLQSPRDVMAIDIGGDKIRSATYTFRNGTFTKRDEEIVRSTGGAGYLAFLERLAEEAIANDLRVGISSATKMAGSIVTRTVNLPVFFAEFGASYGADYANLFPGRSFVANDTIMGICGSSTLLALRGIDARDVSFFICGSGVGASVIADGTAIHVEAAHVPVMESLNPLGQTTLCGVAGKDYVCLERVTAARAGIEDLYRRQTGEARDGVALGRMYEDGDALATVLYETSALALAHATAGVMERYGFSDPARSAVVFHGGNFEMGKYRDEVTQRLNGMPHPPSRVVFSRDLSGNVCLDGAAITAVYVDGEHG